MTATAHDVFISYARRDGLAFAERLDNDLAQAGLRVWRDKRNLDPAQDFTSELEKAIEQAQHVVVCLTPDTKRDESFVRREIQYAMLSGKPIVPLRFADMVPPIHVVNFTFIDFFREKWDMALGELVRRLGQPTSRYQPPQLPEDPCREYLNLVYQSIVNYLDKTVFSLITLSTEASPSAVDAPRAQPAPALPMAFFDMLPDNSPSYTDFPTAFERYGGRMLLLSEPGGGKTTTLMAYARDAVAGRLEDPAQPLPLIAPIGAWDAQNAPPMQDWLAGQIRALSADAIAQTLADGKALLLLDGLDELGSERVDEQTKQPFDPRLRFIERIPPNNRILVTCRVKDYAEIGKRIALDGAINLQPLNDNQMRAYLAQQPDLLAAIEGDAVLREMSRTPLILSLFTFAYAGIGAEAARLRDLTHSPGDLRDKIFETYIRRRYEREARKPHAKLPFTLEDIYEVLGGIATMNVARDAIAPDSMLSVNDFAHEIGAERAAAFVELAARLHILVPDGDEKWKFIHAMVRAYFAFAWALKRVQHIEYPPAIRRRSAYALAYLKDTRSYHTLAQAFTIRNQPVNVRGEMAFALGRLGDSRAVEILLDGLTDDELYIRYQSAVALGEIGDHRAFDPVLSRLNDPSQDVRYGAVRALGKLGDLRAVPALIAMLNDPVDYVRSSAARSLGELHASDAVDALMSALKDEVAAVRHCAAQALQRIGTPEALSALATQ